jgi:hypothetical protein
MTPNTAAPPIPAMIIVPRFIRSSSNNDHVAAGAQPSSVQVRTPPNKLAILGTE